MDNIIFEHSYHEFGFNILIKNNLNPNLKYKVVINDIESQEWMNITDNHVSYVFKYDDVILNRFNNVDITIMDDIDIIKVISYRFFGVKPELVFSYNNSVIKSLDLGEIDSNMAIAISLRNRTPFNMSGVRIYDKNSIGYVSLDSVNWYESIVSDPINSGETITIYVKIVKGSSSYRNEKISLQVKNIY